MPAVQRQAPPKPCAKYETNERDKSQKAGYLSPDALLAGGRSIAGLDPELVVISDFGVGSATVKGATKSELKGSWIDIMERQAGKKYDIVGYSDCVGEGLDNLMLRDNRAWNIAGQFPKLGAQAAYIGPAPATEFLVDNTTAENRAINRGVVLRPPKGAPPLPKPKKAPRDPHVMVPMQEPSSEGCDQNQKAQLSIAWPAAKLMAQKAIENLRTDKGGVNGFLLRRYFGEDVMGHLPEIRAGYQRSSIAGSTGT